MTDLEHAGLCARIYAADASTDKFWAHYWTAADIVCGHVQLDGVDYLVFRGSVTPEDWMRDMDAIPAWHAKLGFVHAGFYEGLDTLYPLITAAVGKSIVVLGHSLGAARACDVAGLFAYDAAAAGLPCPVQTLCTFGQPKPGFVNLARLITKSGMAHRSYRNRNDPVPLVPFTIAALMDFVHTEDWIALDAAPSPTDLEPLRDHHIGLYVQGLTPPPSVPAQPSA